jgi:hypothetical protein
MKPFLIGLLALLCAATGHGQTMKALAFNTSNGVVVVGTNALTFTSPVSFSTLAFTNITASNITLNGVLSFTNGPTNQLQLTRANLLPAYSGNASKVLALNSNATDLQWVTMTAGTNTNTVNFPILISQGGSGATTASGARNNLSLGAAWLTNTNVGTFRSDIGLGGAWLTNANVTNFRTAIGLGATFLTNTNAATFASAIGLGAGNAPSFNGLFVNGMMEMADGNSVYVDGELIIDAIFKFEQPLRFAASWAADESRFNLGLGAAWLTNTNASNFLAALGLGATNTPAFRGLTSDGNIVITNQTATNNGILFVYRTNNEPFLGLANLIASNNTTISNETLFRVGTAEATNRSAQFGFRSTNTNGSGVAVFSVFGFNALMMVGADASTNAVIYSGGGTNNEVMTLIRDGATEFARPIRFSTNASTRPATNAPANTTNVAAWVEFRIGTNSYRAPLYQ